MLADDVSDQPARVLLLIGAGQLALAAAKPPLLLAVQPVPDLAVNGAKQIWINHRVSPTGLVGTPESKAPA